MSLPATLRGLILALAVAPAFARAAPADALPPIQFNGTVAGDELYNLLKADPQFANLSKELIGCPIVLRVTHSFALTSGGKASAFGSAIWAGGTLGLLPVVTNNDLVITYDLVVNGTVLATHAYQRNFTRAVNIWANDTTYGLGKDGLAWAKGTVAEFSAAVANDPKFASLAAEYAFYFGAQPQ
ncbi:MAG TPA: hypothetical protein VE046_11910 [Steroidobacteraceae bacterium]|nr:hypothetical protein [Steroidobacteraceae bacterium]